MLNNARQRLFWPGLDAQLRLTKAQCLTCNQIAPSQAREPLLEDTPTPELPFQMTVADFFEKSGHKYLIYADRYSGWVEVALMNRTNAQAVNATLRKWFCTYGVPKELATDGAPPPF